MKTNVRYEINLIEGEVLPRKKRAACFWCMVAYFTVCCFVVVIVANRVTRSLVASRGIRDEIRELEHAVRKAYPKHQNAVVGMRMFSEELTTEATRLDSLSRALKLRRHVGRILAELNRPLPHGAYILNFALDAKEGDVSFDVVIPEDARDDTPDASELLAEWGNDEALLHEISNLTSTISKRQRVDGKPSFVLSFACQLVKGKA